MWLYLQSLRHCDVYLHTVGFTFTVCQSAYFLSKSKWDTIDSFKFHLSLHTASGSTRDVRLFMFFQVNSLIEELLRPPI